MASAGVASRRECEIIIEEGRVEVDGEIVVKLGTKVDPDKQKVYFDGQRIVVQDHQYFVLNKPPGIVSTSNDPSGRPRVIDLIDTNKRVYNVGRLDQSSEGLILVTNDGELANQLTHPRFGIEKKYHVLVDGRPEYSALKQLEDGIYLADGKVQASHIKFLKKAKNGSWLEIILTEGRNREIRRMLSTIGHKVRTLKRVAIGPLRLGDLPRGAHRPLTPAELKALKRAASGESALKRRKAKKKKALERKATKGKSDQRKNDPAQDIRCHCKNAPSVRIGVARSVQRNEKRTPRFKEYFGAFDNQTQQEIALRPPWTVRPSICSLVMHYARQTSCTLATLSVGKEKANV